MSPCQRIHLGDGLVARATLGTGPRVLWIHGYTMSSELWSGLWLRLPEFAHIGIDLPGHGASPTPHEAQTLPELARTIGSAAVEHGVEHIVGLSFGAIIALQVAIELPQTFRTFTLAAASFTGAPDEPGARDRYRQLIRLHRERGPGPWMTETWMRSPPDIFTGTAEHPRLRREVASVIDRHSWTELKTGFLQRWISHCQADRLDDLARIRAALLLLIGEREMRTFRASADAIHARVADAQIVTLAGAGHLCILEAPDASSRLIAAHVLCHRSRGSPIP